MKIFYGWWVVLASFITGMYVAGTIFYSFTAFIDPMVKEFGWSYTQISLASSLRGLEMGIFAPIIGIYLDKYGSRMIMLVGMLVVGLSLVLLSTIHSLAMFYVCFIILAFGAGGCTSVVVMASVANWFKKRVGLAMGIAVCGFGASGLMVPIVVKLIEVFGWRSAFLYMGIGAWVIGIPLSFVIRNRPEDYGMLPDGEIKIENGLEQEEEIPEVQVTFKQALTNRSFLLIVSAEWIRMMTVGTLITHIMPYLTSMGVSRSMAGFISAGIPLCSIIGRFGFGWLGDIHDKRHMIALGFGLICLGLLMFLKINSTMIFVVVFIVAFPIGYGGGMSLRGAIIREYFGRASFGKMVGLTMGVSSVAGIIGPTLGGWVFDHFGSYHPLWVGFIFLNALGMVLILRVKPAHFESF
ncbi:MAG: MFS transporter [Proteobacteria bacterium]|nr:MFS transporter [Pseudomonadota bacterium]MBU4468978.1 MFS transporter [Pseudomonadota bacterium]MCG2752092.1 MFS transporter [Desulfobacteraceae bacterium]